MTEHEGTFQDTEDEVKLVPMLKTLWAYRQTLRKAMLIATAAVAVLFIAAWFLMPADRFGTKLEHIRTARG